ncbi:type I-F CRISPR-associated endonuclease Cas1f [Anaeroglobus geminatus]|uniref:CRISPR-associated endonuclease Cas1, YPEST subtype n=1 Tax=Anaeroglobus geminatus F0357 TaxID=861450 RepID=G9YI67_9FIRM|nr:type I-F CRISPR-associated endonuclease Cas1f [Anaeroglobus geminatus]EHM40138.1 CRISPR-associated endonuclease Cas1, YPEST subtype [Anaeroglobus geminatus F0357]
MEDLGKSELKAILHSKRANIYYLEKCRIMQKDGRVLYLTDGKKANLYWNIPIANTTVILLGTGTSITQAAMRLLAAAGVLVGFCGGGCTPLFSGGEIEWLNPQSEYRPTEYLQRWISFWFNENKRLEAAKYFQRKRCEYLEKIWDKDRELGQYQFYLDDKAVEQALTIYKRNIEVAGDVTKLLTSEAEFTKRLYKYAAQKTDNNEFIRNHDGADSSNTFLNHGNYLAYGLGACTLWVLGIPHGLAVMHGKTRRGALVFDVADLVKDTLVLPWAFISALEGRKEQEFRQTCLQKFTEHKALDFMFEEVKNVSALFKADDIL